MPTSEDRRTGTGPRDGEGRDGDRARPARKEPRQIDDGEGEMAKDRVRFLTPED